MIDLKINGETTTLKANFGFYQNIVGKDKEEINQKFDDFISRMLQNDIDTLLDFYFALCDHKLSKDEIIEQLDSAKVFDNIDKEFEDDFQVMCDSGFFKSKIAQWLKAQKDILKAYTKVMKEISKKKSDQSLEEFQEQQLQVEAEAESMKLRITENEKILKKYKVI